MGLCRAQPQVRQQGSWAIMLLLLHSWATCVLETLQCDKNLGFEIIVACVCILTVFYWASRSSCLWPSFLEYEHEVEFSCFKVLFSLISFNIRTPWLWLCLETWLCFPERWPANTRGPMASTASPEISTRKSNVNSLPFSVASYVLSSCFPLSFHLFFPFYSSSLPPFFLFLPPLISFSPSLFSSLLKSLLCSTSLFFFFSLPYSSTLSLYPLCLCFLSFFSIIYHSTNALWYLLSTWYCSGYTLWKRMSLGSSLHFSQRIGRDRKVSW